VFEGHSIGQLIASHLTQTPPQLTGLRSDVPLDLAAVLQRCLAKDPADRFANVSELERALGHCGCAADWSEDAAACWWQSTIEVEDAPDLSFDSQGSSTASSATNNARFGVRTIPARHPWPAPPAHPNCRGHSARGRCRKTAQGDSGRRAV